jgi:F-type H+-transporting ATPase subunit epsilon
MTLQVALVVPEGEIWTGSARIVIAKTLDGDIGVMSGHAPVLGILAAGSVVQIRPDEGGGEDVTAAVDGGFFSIADDRVSILARQAHLALEASGPEESAEVRYYRAQLRAAGAGS